MRLSVRVLALACTTLLLAACGDVVLGFSGDEHREDFHYTYSLSAGGKITVENYNGSVDISGWDQGNVEISGTKYAHSARDLGEIRVDVASSPNSIAIRTLPVPHLFRSGGVRYVIHVPRRAELEDIQTANGPIRVNMIDGSARLHTSNGPIHASSIKGSLDAATSNGPMEITGLMGRAELRTSNGRIDLTMEAAQEVRASTSNGAISVRLPAGAGYDVRARTSNGSISSDFDVSVRGRIERHSLNGTIGSGGPLLDLTTSNGAIRLMRL